MRQWYGVVAKSTSNLIKCAENLLMPSVKTHRLPHWNKHMCFSSKITSRLVQFWRLPKYEVEALFKYDKFWSSLNMVLGTGIPKEEKPSVRDMSIQ